MTSDVLSEYNPREVITALTSELLNAPVAQSTRPAETATHVHCVDSTSSQCRANGQVASRYQRLAADPRFFQFANIPNRLIKCLDSFEIEANQEDMRSALLAYYIFIAVTDDAIDGGDPDAGESILARIANPRVRLSGDAALSDAEFMAEVLKLYFPARASAQIRMKFRTLYRITLDEQRARSMREFVKTRKLLGRVTADISYLLVRDYLRNDVWKLRRLMKQVGAVGCLIDTVIDARKDQRAGLLSFRPSIAEWLYFYAHTLVLGLRVALKHTKLIRLFCEAIIDNVYDRRRAQVAER